MIQQSFFVQFVLDERVTETMTQCQTKNNKKKFFFFAVRMEWVNVADWFYIYDIPKQQKKMEGGMENLDSACRSRSESRV